MAPHLTLAELDSLQEKQKAGKYFFVWYVVGHPGSSESRHCRFVVGATRTGEHAVLCRPVGGSWALMMAALPKHILE